MKNAKDNKAYEVGFPIFEKLFEMKKNDLLVVLREICNGKFQSDLLDDDSKITKQIEDDIPVKIIVSSYDILIITPLGIEYRAEPGHFQNIAEFNKFFQL